MNGGTLCGTIVSGGTNMKVHVNLNDDLLKQVDEHCKEQFQTRSGFINQVLAEYFLRLEFTKNIASQELMKKAYEEVIEICRKEME